MNEGGEINLKFVGSLLLAKNSTAAGKRFMYITTSIVEL